MDHAVREAIVVVGESHVVVGESYFGLLESFSHQVWVYLVSDVICARRAVHLEKQMAIYIQLDLRCITAHIYTSHSTL